MLCENLRDRYVIYLPLAGRSDLLCLNSAFELHLAAHCNVRASHSAISAALPATGAVGQEAQANSKGIRGDKTQTLRHKGQVT